MNINKKSLLKNILLPLLVGSLAAFLTRGSMSVFEAMNQPPLSPPGILFPIVWTILYTLMGVSFYLIESTIVPSDLKAEASFLYYLQLAVNFLWPIFFFQLKWYLFSFFWLILLLILVAKMIKQFACISRPAAYMNTPYLVWLIFAAYLNYGVWILN